MQRYKYEGPVMLFERIVDEYWQSETYAISSARARSNFAYQYKKLIGLERGAKITLPGKIIKMDKEA